MKSGILNSGKNDDRTSRNTTVPIQNSTVTRNNANFNSTYYKHGSNTNFDMNQNKDPKTVTQVSNNYM